MWFLRRAGLFFGLLPILGTLINSGVGANAASTNHDEARVRPYVLPEVLAASDASPITNAAGWFDRRRPELLALFENHVYGPVPRRPQGMRFRIVREDEAALDGTARRLDVELDLPGAKPETVLSFSVFLPKAARGPVPLFVGVHLFDTRKPVPWLAAAVSQRGKPRLAAEDPAVLGRAVTDRILARGYGVASLDIDRLCPDSRTNFLAGAAAALGVGLGRETNAPGALSFWAWGLSRAMDFFETRPDIDARRVVVMGHSRMGKAALWAGANDIRFAAVISNDSGCGGAALSKRDFGETVAVITRAFPHWFCPAFATYSSREEHLPVDQHQLVALLAPRPVLIASAQDDAWADPKGEYLSAHHASAVYRMLNSGGVGLETQPPVGALAGDRICYVCRPGQHDLTDVDWANHLAFAERYLGR